jgi:hypothetical protein
MIIIRITQEKSNAHTEFQLLPDYIPVPRINYELAREWAEKGLLSKFDAAHLMMLENQRNYYAAIRDITARMGAQRLEKEVDDYVEQLTHRHDPPAPVAEASGR